MKLGWQLLLNILLAYICKNDFLFGRSLSRSLIIRALWKLWQIIRRFTVAGKLKTLSFLLFIHNSKKKLLKIKKGQVGQISQKWCSYCLRGISNLVLFLEEKIKELEIKNEQLENNIKDMNSVNKRDFRIYKEKEYHSCKRGRDPQFRGSNTNFVQKVFFLSDFAEITQKAK